MVFFQILLGIFHGFLLGFSNGFQTAVLLKHVLLVGFSRICFLFSFSKVFWGFPLKFH